MKLIVITILCLHFLIQSTPQNPVHWQYSVNKTIGSIFEVHIVATVDQPWHIYSTSTPKLGPVPTKITFTKTPLFNIIGGLEEIGEPHIKHEDVFGVDVIYYENKVEFVRKIKLKSNVKMALICNIQFMACTDRECLKPDNIHLNIKLDCK